VAGVMDEESGVGVSDIIGPLSAENSKLKEENVKLSKELVKLRKDHAKSVNGSEGECICVLIIILLFFVYVYISEYPIEESIEFVKTENSKVMIRENRVTLGGRRRCSVFIDREMKEGIFRLYVYFVLFILFIYFIVFYVMLFFGFIYL
jgi:hypothetical protein